MSNRTEYRIELYLDSYIDDPIASFCPATPFVGLNIGDEIDPRAWSDGNDESYSNSVEVPNGYILKVTKIRHLLMIGKNKITPSISVKVKAEPKDD